MKPEEENLEKLKVLFQYTLFHIGLYATLITGLMAMLSLGKSDGLRLIEQFHYPFKVTLGCMLMAGMCGGVIGSNMPGFISFKTFETTRIGFWGMRFLEGQNWVFFEHLFFWVGVLNGVAAFYIGKNYHWKIGLVVGLIVFLVFIISSIISSIKGCKKV